MIRIARSKADVAACRALDALMFPGNPYVNKDAVWWTGYAFGEPCAYAALAPLPKEPGGVFLARAGVLRKARGRGLQRQLIRARLAFAKRHGYEWAITYASYDNTTSANNLIACGFRLYKPHEQWGIDGSYYFVKTLNAPAT